MVYILRKHFVFKFASLHAIHTKFMTICDFIPQNGYRPAVEPQRFTRSSVFASKEA